LLNMTAPVNDDYVFDPAFEAAFAADIHRTFEQDELIGYVYPGTEERSAPWQYINTQYILAGMIVSKASGMSYANALKEMIFEPLQLRETYYRPRVPPKRVLDLMPSGYFNQSYCKEFAHIDPPCPQFPIDSLLGQNLKTVNLSIYDASGGIVASLPDVSRWVRAMFSDTLLLPQQKEELFSLVSELSGQPIAAVSKDDPTGFSMGIVQGWQPFLKSPIVWTYTGQSYGYTVQWFRRPGDELVFVIGVNSVANTPTAKSDIPPLYETVFRILEPESVVGPTAAPPPSLAQQDVVQ
jgi:D-alanyl-D-alanine carboxypeptidase